MAGRTKSKQKLITKYNAGYFMVAPFIIVFLIFGLYPIMNTFWLALTDATLMGGGQGDFNGIKNFKIIFNDPFFVQAFLNTWKIWLLNFVPQLGAALLLAVWLTSKKMNIKAVGFWRGVYYLPNLLMPATVSVLYAQFFSYYGPVNQFLVRVGFVDEALLFFNSEPFAQGITAFIQWWMWFGNTVIIMFAGMTSISVSLYESADMDGANGIQKFMRVTLPLLKPILVYTLVTSLVGGMQMFDIPYMLTNGRGAPNGSIMTLNVLMYAKFTSSKGHIGLAATVGVCIFVVTTILSIAIFYLLRDRDLDEIKKIERVKRKIERQAKKIHKGERLNGKY